MTDNPVHVVIWSCEDPGVIMGTIIPCEKCEPCITYQTALYRNKLIKRK